MATEFVNGQVPETVAGGDIAPKKPVNKKLTVEKIYQKKSQLEHILLRPDTYIGNQLAVFFLCVLETELVYKPYCIEEIVLS
jgi:hypothetical protein